MNYSLYTLNQLEYMAYCDDNELALAIYKKGQEEKERELEEDVINAIKAGMELNV